MIEFFFQNYKNATTQTIVLEAIVFITGILSVFFAKKQNILVYPIGLIATMITVYLLYSVGYFADMFVNLYYSIMSIYGWIKWQSKSKNEQLKISYTNTNQKIIALVIFFVSAILNYAVYIIFDNDLQLPNYIDIFTSSIFFTAMWLMALKKIENWIFWIMGNCMVVPLFAYRGLGMLSLQYLIFTIMAFYAYKEWKNSLNK